MRIISQGVSRVHKSLYNRHNGYIKHHSKLIVQDHFKFLSLTCYYMYMYMYHCNTKECPHTYVEPENLSEKKGNSTACFYNRKILCLMYFHENFIIYSNLYMYMYIKLQRFCQILICQYYQLYVHLVKQAFKSTSIALHVPQQLLYIPDHDIHT